MIKGLPYCIKLNSLDYKLTDDWGIDQNYGYLTDGYQLEESVSKLSKMNSEERDHATFLTPAELRQMVLELEK